MGRPGRPRPPPLTDGGDVRGVELVVGEAAQQAGLAYPGVPDQQQPEQHIVLLRHGWAGGPAGGRAAGSAPLGPGHRGARPPENCAGGEKEAGPARAASPPLARCREACAAGARWEERAGPRPPLPLRRRRRCPERGRGTRAGEETPSAGVGRGRCALPAPRVRSPDRDPPRDPPSLRRDPGQSGEGGGERFCLPADLLNGGVGMSSHPAHLYQTRLSGLVPSLQIACRTWPCQLQPSGAPRPCGSLLGGGGGSGWSSPRLTPGSEGLDLNRDSSTGLLWKSRSPGTLGSYC